MAVPDYIVKDIKHCKVRNMNVIEELGEIEYLFCDKTGTLTQNELAFRAFSIAGTQKQYAGTIAQMKEAIDSNRIDEMTQLFFNCINTCHECVLIENRQKPGETEYSGPSVDEICFLNMARDLQTGGYFLGRDSHNVAIKLPDSESPL